MCNLCHHKLDYKINGKYMIFATSYRKQPCDEIGGTMKELVASASFQCINNSQILISYDTFQ